QLCAARRRNQCLCLLSDPSTTMTAFSRFGSAAARCLTWLRFSGPLAAAIFFASPAGAATNVWLGTNSDWGDATNWSLGLPSPDHSIFIGYMTNAAPTITAFTASSTFTVSNVTIARNSLNLSSSFGPATNAFHILDWLSIESGGGFTMYDSG